MSLNLLHGGLVLAFCIKGPEVLTELGPCWSAFGKWSLFTSSAKGTPLGGAHVLREGRPLILLSFALDAKGLGAACGTIYKPPEIVWVSSKTMLQFPSRFPHLISLTCNHAVVCVFVSCLKLVKNY